MLDVDPPLLVLNPYVFDDYNLDGALQQLKNAGLDQLVSYRRNMYQKQASYVFEPLARSLVANTPGYRLLERFHMPRHKWNERPLTSQERLIEEQMAEQAIRQRHGLSDRESLRLHPNAYREYNRAVFGIDETTRYDRQNVSEAPPMERARNFFKQIIIRDSAVPGEVLEEVRTVGTTDEDGSTSWQRLFIKTDKMEFRTDGESLVNYAGQQGFLSSPDMRLMRSISVYFIREMALHLFDSSREEQDYAKVIEQLLTDQAKRVTDELSALATADIRSDHFSTFATLLTMPSDYDEELENFAITVPILPGNNNVESLISRENFNKAEHETLGRIRKRPFDDQTTRLLQYEHPVAPVPDLNTQAADLVLHLPKLDRALVPRIYGYTVQGYDAHKQLYDLRYTPEADPYSECDTPIPDSARVELSHVYAEIGMQELATLVYSSSSLTVGELARHISETNQYFIPVESTPYRVPERLEDYAEEVREGKLNLQCVGASHFLRSSLEKVFGAASTSTISGDSIPASGTKINAMRHQQTTFTDPETMLLYILDCTPVRPNRLGWRSALSNHASRRGRRLGSKALGATRIVPVASTTRPEQVSADIGDTSEVPNTTYRGELISQAKDAITLQLRMVLGQDGAPITQGHMYEHVAGLGEDDIVYRSLSATVLAAEGRLDKEQAVRLRQYINNLRNCRDRSLLRKLDPNGYTSQPYLMNMLYEHADQLVRLLPE